jgi:hypothetical protein
MKYLDDEDEGLNIEGDEQVPLEQEPEQLPEPGNEV